MRLQYFGISTRMAASVTTAFLGLALISSPVLLAQGKAGGTESGDATTISVNAGGPVTPFPHFWEKVFGSGRAILSLREGYRDDLRAVKKVTELKEIRFHGIFQDEIGLYDLDANGHPIYNFSYVDQIYDGLLANGVRPFVELSFMPKKLASDPAALHAFWYKQNVSAPKDYALWDGMIAAFAQHLVERYGLEEVAQWDFEVWNEPNIDFWVGKPAQATYFELYDHTARAIKRVNPRLRVGGPSTAQANWVGDFLKHCKEAGVPVDFATTHVYANDTAKDVFAGSSENIPRDRMVCRSVKKVHDEIAASPLPQIPLIFSEYNASYANEPNVTDSVFMGPWLAATISQCDGLTQAMSYWSFSDVFEEQGVVKTPFYGGFGLMAVDNIPKPAYNAFAMLHELGDQRLAVASDAALATRRGDGEVAIAVWNYAPPTGTGAEYTKPTGPAGPAKTYTVKVSGVGAGAAVKMWRLDDDHGNVVKAYDAMGRPATPSREQITALRKAGQASPMERTTLKGGSLTVTIPAQGLVVMTIGKR